jgi:predicted ATPase/class 3 adenylate cyclase
LAEVEAVAGRTTVRPARHHAAVRTDLPQGTVTFLFTDVEASTKLLHDLGEDNYAEALAEHRRVLRLAFQRHGGAEVDTQDDAFFVAFPTARGALEAASEGVQELAGGPIRVRVGIHTGTPLLTHEGYVGADVHRAARIAACGHGGQVLVSASTATLGGADRLRDLGEHRLQDLSTPERIYQLGEGEFPPLKSLSRTNLPIPATPFLGRGRELTEVLDLLARPAVRLLTLTGPGGTGKTRLGLQAAAEAADRYPDGVFWVPLSETRNVELVLESAAQALGAKNELADHIADKRLLLLLDNFEHVVGAADDLTALLGSCPNMQLLVTSRELLRLPSEQTYPVPPLEPEEGTELFLARARATDPGFVTSAAVRELCARLEQLPLALELAAARLRVLSPEQLLVRLSSRLDVLKAGRGVDPRQQTLRATIEWSRDLLNSEERTFFRRLAVFAGGCTLESAEEVCDADLDTLQSLVDKSLVRFREGDRFWMLETIREYGAEQLEVSGEAEELRLRHAEHFLALAEKAEPSILGINPRGWLDRLEREHENLRAALDWLEATGRTDQALRLGGAIWEFWCLRGHPVEGWQRLERLLELDQRPTLARAKALTGSGHLAPQVPQAGSAHRRRRDEQALALYRELGDPWGIAYTEFQLATTYALDGDFETALPLVEESVPRLREVGDEHRALQALRNLALCTFQLSRAERARPYYEELLASAREAGDAHLEGRALATLAVFASDEGRHRVALRTLGDAYRIDRDLGDPAELMEDLVDFARVLVAAGEAELAVQLIARAEAERERLGLAFPPWVIARRDFVEERARTLLGEVAFAEAWERGRTLTLEEAALACPRASGLSRRGLEGSQAVLSGPVGGKPQRTRVRHRCVAWAWPPESKRTCMREHSTTLPRAWSSSGTRSGATSAWRRRRSRWLSSPACSIRRSRCPSSSAVSWLLRSEREPCGVGGICSSCWRASRTPT